MRTSHGSPVHPDPGPPALTDDGHLEFTLAGHRGARAVHLLQEIARPRTGPAFERVAGGWRARFHPGPTDRVEYRYAVTDQHGRTEVLTDPHNPAVVDTPFGARSVWTRATYRDPDWWDAAPDRRGERASTQLRASAPARRIEVRHWTHPALVAGQRAPLLLVHDGPAYDDEAGLGRLLDHLVGDATVPPFRAAMLGAPDRQRLYSASPRWSRAITDEVVPHATTHGDRPGAAATVVGLGSSLGALAHLHAAVRAEGTYGGLLLQSGSYFLPELDGVESDFTWFDRITDFTRSLLRDGPGAPIETTITCGLVEENLRNNTVVAEALAAAGWPVRMVRHRDAHNMTSWRDTLDPHLADLLRRVEV